MIILNLIYTKAVSCTWNHSQHHFSTSGVYSHKTKVVEICGAEGYLLISYIKSKEKTQIWSLFTFIIHDYYEFLLLNSCEWVNSSYTVFVFFLYLLSLFQTTNQHIYIYILAHTFTHRHACVVCTVVSSGVQVEVFLQHIHQRVNVCAAVRPGVQA